MTFEYMQDLKQTIENLKGRDYAIVPDCAIYWMKAHVRNPLSIDWPQDIELSNKALFTRVVSDMESRHGRLAIVVAKFTGFSLARYKLEPITATR